MNAVLVVFGKEVVDNLRDRRSFMMALIYPLIGPLLLGILVFTVTGAVSKKVYQTPEIRILGGQNAPEFVTYLKDEVGVKFLDVPDDPRGAVRSGEINGFVEIPDNYQTLFEAGKAVNIKVIIDHSRLSGLLELGNMTNIIGRYNAKISKRRMSEKGVEDVVFSPLKIKTVNPAKRAHFADFFLFMVPPFLVFSVFMGGFYLAVDTTSGERERGSMEPLLINPVPRWALLLGKFMAAWAFTVIAVAVQLLAFKATFALLGSTGTGFSRHLEWSGMLYLLIAALPLMFLAVSIQVAIATITRTYKEAQTYLGLLPLIPAAPGLALVFLPVSATWWMMLVPAFSQTLLFGDLVRNEPISLIYLLTSAIATTAVGAVILLITARFYEREQLVFGG